MRVVLVDDTDHVRELVAEVVTGAGHEVVGHAHDGWEGVELAMAERPDAVITNWRMPRMNGIETTRRIRAAYPGIAILALVSTEDPQVRDGFLRAGADAVIDKRDMRGLLAAVRAVEGARAQPPRQSVQPTTSGVSEREHGTGGVIAVAQNCQRVAPYGSAVATPNTVSAPTR